MIEPPDVTVVTGAAGWLGRALVDQLTRQGGLYHRPGRVRALVHRPVDQDTFAGCPQVETVLGDVRRPDGLRALFADLSGTVDVVHTAGVIHPDRIDELEEVNARGTGNVVDAARRSGVRRFVHVSSNSPFGTNPHPGDTFRNEEPYDPYLGYGRSKMQAELRVLAAAEHGLDAVIVRPPWFYGPHGPERQLTFLRLVRAGRFPVLGRGQQRRSMVYVDNLVQGVVLAELTPTEPGRGWWIADARPYTVHEIVTTVAAALEAEGCPARANPLRLPALVGRVAERADRLVQRSGRYVAQVHVLGEMGKTIACDIAAAQADLGYEPEVDLEEGMRRTVRWHLARGDRL